MRRGTTPTHTFTLPFNTADIKALRITYKQNGVKVTKTDYTAGENTISVTLTQNESLCFEGNKTAKVQIKVLMTDGSVQVSNIMTFMVAECLDNEVIE